MRRGDELLELVRDLLELAQAQRQSPELKPVPVPLVGSLSKSLETLTEQAQLKGVSLSVEGVDDVIVYANEEDVQRILANLLENAVQTPRPATTSKSALPQCGQLMNEWASSGTRSSTLAATLAAAGRRTGLLDLDFTGPCGHLVLGALPVFPDEDFGILAQQVAGVHFMSIACFAGATPAPLRGADVSNALIELLAITRWGELDTLVIDMPPGLGDAALDIVRLLPRAQYLVVTSSARLVVETVRRTLTLLHRSDQQALAAR